MDRRRQAKREGRRWDLARSTPPFDTLAVRLRHLVLWLLPFTIAFVVAEFFLLRGMTAPIDPFGQQMATYFAAVVGLAWLAVVIAFVWAWRRLQK